METSKRRSSSSSRSSDSGHDMRYESLRKWEETLKAREQEIERMEKRLKESEELLKREDGLKKLEKQLTLRENEIDGTLMIIFCFYRLGSIFITNHTQSNSFYVNIFVGKIIPKTLETDKMNLTIIIMYCSQNTKCYTQRKTSRRKNGKVRNFFR